jgi:Sulfotransferase family
MHPLKIVHHHIFKCAGSTFAWILQRNFPGRVLHVEGSRENQRITCPNVRKTLIADQFDALSSHLLTLPALTEAIAPLHVILLRNPISRWLSSYNFVKKRGDIDSGTSFESYIHHILNSYGKNFQVQYVSLQSASTLSAHNGWFADPLSIDLQRSDLFFGLVEYFDESMLVLEHRLAHHNIQFDGAYRSIINADSSGTVQHLSQPLCNDLIRENTLEFELYDRVKHRLLQEQTQLDPDGVYLSKYRRRCQSVATGEIARWMPPESSEWTLI